LKVGWGVGVALAVLVSLAAYLFGLFGPLYSIIAVELLASTIFLLVGLWTLASGFFIVEAKDRTYYSVWGVVLACLALFAYVPPAIALGILILAIVVLIVLVLFTGRTQKMFTAATSPPSPAGPTPAA
jgi:hypothetical protein